MKKPKQVRTIQWLDAGQWPFIGICFSSGFSYDQLVKHLTKNKAPDWVEGIKNDKELIDGGKFFGLRRTLPGTKKDPRPSHLLYIILTEPFDHSDTAYVTLAHEVFHLVQYIFDVVCADMIEEKESAAYTHSHIMHQCLNKLRNPK